MWGESLLTCLQTQAHWDQAGDMDILALPPARQNQDVSSTKQHLHSGFLSPSPLLSVSPSCLLGERKQKLLSLSPTLSLIGERKKEGDFLDLLLGMKCCHGNNLSPGIAWAGRKWQPELRTLAREDTKGYDRGFPTWMLSPVFSSFCHFPPQPTPTLSPHK